MNRSTTLSVAAAAVLGIAALAAGCSGSPGTAASARSSHTSASSGRVVVKAASNKTLGKTILVTLKGRSLYSLSVEVHGKFICKDAYCLSLWTPLVVPRGTTPAGASSLATVRRPDGRTQVTYRGRPLYTFNEDRKPGDVKGNGFKDVGTWLVASAKTGSVPTPSPSGKGGYHY